VLFDYPIPDVMGFQGFQRAAPPMGVPEGRRAAGGGMFLYPAAYLASALFAASRLRRRRATECAALPVLKGGARLVFSGERLDQDDLDVFLGCVEHSLEQQRPGRGSVRFAVDDFLRRLGRRDTPATRERLAASLLRIELSRIALCDEEMNAYANLLVCVGFDLGRDVWFAEVNPDVLAAFARATNPLGFIHTRLRLGPRPLAKWLFGLAWTLQDDCLLRSGELRRLCGCQALEGAPFRALFRKALSALALVGYGAAVTEDREGWVWVRGQKGGPGLGNSRLA